MPPAAQPTPNPLEFLAADLARLEADGLVMEWPTLEAPQEPRTVLDGRPVINMAANNYLGLANHPAVKEAAAAALARYGAGVASARNACGNLPLHDELEARLAAFKGVEAVLVTQTGYVANLGIFPALLGEADAIVSDALNHASLIDSARMSRARVHVYAHGDVGDADAKLAAAADGGARRIALVTDGIFSMDGDIAPLPGLIEAAEAAGAFAYVDDAHAVGVIGKGGRGTVDHFGLEGRVAIQVGTLSKALGIMGGYIAGSRELIRWLEQRHRAQFFSASTLTPADTAAALKALDIIEAEPERIERLWARAAYFRAGLNALGFDTGVSVTPLIPVIIGGAANTKALRDALMAAGVFAVAVAYPIVAEDASRLRTIVSSEHTEADLDEVLDAFRRCGRSAGIL
ncbi:MAG TPA: aminotransferase class I/II-fold pyridoxal phosphate-dependent enzyme [Alphaproteobacteria bacterium]|nr:aminotransferase class I/II-fold pyridoxal phosphate-dependent enzyme [Alphaproteobacteria bacterium]